MVRRLLRGTIGFVLLIEAMAFFAGAALHLGLSLPVPYVESGSLVSAAFEAASGALFLVAVAAIFVHYRRAWEIAVAAHVTGVASIAFGIATRKSSMAMQTSHHPPMLLVLIVLLLALATPPVHHALENGRRRSKRRRQAMYSL